MNNINQIQDRMFNDIFNHVHHQLAVLLCSQMYQQSDCKLTDTAWIGLNNRIDTPIRNVVNTQVRDRVMTQTTL